MASGDTSVTLSDAARAHLVLDDEEAQLRQRQLSLAAEQYAIWQRLEEIKAFRSKLWRAVHHET